jgi:hypothetical protein
MKKKSIHRYLNRHTAYVIVHPDEYAIGVSPITGQKANLFMLRLKGRIRILLKEHVVVYLLNLAQETLAPPAYLNEFQQKKNFHVIPVFKDDSIDAQVLRLRMALMKFTGLEQIIFTGGWQNACLKYTMNNTLRGIPRIKFVERVDGPLAAQVCFESNTVDVIVRVDHEFVF